MMPAIQLNKVPLTAPIALCFFHVILKAIGKTAQLTNVPINSYKYYVNLINTPKEIPMAFKMTANTPIIIPNPAVL
jgi:hypothetical protein